MPIDELLLPEGLKLVDVENPLDGRVYDGRALTRFVPQGYATPTWIHLETEQDEVKYTLIVHPLTGRTEIRDGRIEMERKGF